jgi:hypothetical protein
MEKGFTGNKTYGSTRYHYSEALPYGSDSTKVDSKFDINMFDLMSDLRLYEKERTPKNTAKVQEYLTKIGYLDEGKIDSTFGKTTLGAANRYIKNFEEHPDRGIMNLMKRWMKGL